MGLWQDLDGLSFEIKPDSVVGRKVHDKSDRRAKAWQWIGAEAVPAIETWSVLDYRNRF